MYSNDSSLFWGLTSKQAKGIPKKCMSPEHKLKMKDMYKQTSAKVFIS